MSNLLEHGVELKGQKVTLVGSGGGATPIATQLVQSDIREISVFARDEIFQQRRKKREIHQ